MKRKAVYIFNAIIALVCCAAIALYFIFPVFRIKLSYTVSADTIKEIVGEQDDLNIDGYIDDAGITISLSLGVQSNELICAVVTRSADSYVDSIISEAAAELVSDLLNDMVDFIANVVSEYGVDIVKGIAAEYLVSSGACTEDEVQQKLEESGFTDEYIEDVIASLVAAVNEDGDSESQTDTYIKPDELQASISDMINGLISDDVVVYINYVFIGIAIVLAVSCLSWLYIIIKILCKLRSVNPSVKLKAPIISGWLPYLVLCGVPALMLSILSRLAAEMTALLAAFSISFYSSGVFAAIAAAALIVIWIPYRRYAKPLRRQAKAERASKKR